MTNKQDWKFTHNVADKAKWKPGLRKIFDYRDLGVKDGTNGDFIAHVIRRNAIHSLGVMYSQLTGYPCE